jgi:hypothetical protein
MTGDILGPSELQFLEWCADDFTGVYVAFDIVRVAESPNSFSAEKARALDLVIRLLRAGMIRPGEMTSDAVGLAYWDGSADDLSLRIEKYFGSITSRPHLGDPLWFDATEGGKALVRATNET